MCIISSGWEVANHGKLVVPVLFGHYRLVFFSHPNCGISCNMANNFFRQRGILHLFVSAFLARYFLGCLLHQSP